MPRDEELLPEYEEGWKVTEIFPVNGVGMTTARDGVVIDFEAAPLLERARTFRNSPLSDAEVLKALGINEKLGWDAKKARAMLKNEKDGDELKGKEKGLEQFIKPILYRPFDERKIFYHDALVWRTVRRVMSNMGASNVGMIVGRSGAVTGDAEWNIVFSTKHMLDFNCYRRGGGVLFPLYTYSGGMFEQARENNIAPKYLALMQSIAADAATPESIFHFIYASLHSPAYRARYGAFLKTDFPRVPLPRDAAQFEKLAELGHQLVALHTLDAVGAPVLNHHRFALVGEGANLVSKVEYDAAEGRLRFNATRGFAGVPLEVWEFKIGGYQVAKKWLDDRKTRTLTHKEILHFQKTLVALDETRALMSRIDEIGVVEASSLS